jgi:hypothetical protein
LDAGIFNVYKAAYRGLSKKHAVQWTRDIKGARRKRTLMLGRALVAINQAVIPQHIIQSFRKTGLYPVSFDTFVENTPTLRDVPQEVNDRTKAAAKKRAAELQFKAINRRQISITGRVFRVTG